MPLEVAATSLFFFCLLLNHWLLMKNRRRSLMALPESGEGRSYSLAACALAQVSFFLATGSLGGRFCLESSLQLLHMKAQATS